MFLGVAHSLKNKQRRLFTEMGLQKEYRDEEVCLSVDVYSALFFNYNFDIIKTMSCRFSI